MFFSGCPPACNLACVLVVVAARRAKTHAILSQIWVAGARAASCTLSTEQTTMVSTMLNMGSDSRIARLDSENLSIVRTPGTTIALGGGGVIRAAAASSFAGDAATEAC